MPTYSRVLLLLIILLAVGLRLPAFFGNHFHADEALFASWARLIAIWRDPFLLSQSVDKPPLLFYLQALTYPMLGPVEWAARVPNMIASILLIPLTAVFSWRMFHHGMAALVAALLVTMSPMAIQFSATAFTDPLMTALLIAALLFVVGRSRPFWSGVLFGLAVMTKHQAWLFLPLIGGLAWLNNWRLLQWRRMIAGFLPLAILLFGWQILRSGGLDLWSSQIDNFGGLRPAWSWELVPRLSAWAELWPLTLGSSLMIVLFIFTVPVVWFSGRKSNDTPALADRMLIIFILGYLSLHWLLAVPVWDRYLLPLVPLTAVVLGRGIALATDRFLVGETRPTYRPLFIVLPLVFALAALQMPAAISARIGQAPIGGQRNGDRGAWQVAEFLNQAPYGTVLYDHWFSWHWRYAFIDKGVYTSWFEGPANLVVDLEVFGSTPGIRYLVLPDDGQALPVLRAVKESGFSLHQVLHTGTQPGMILYRIEPS